MNIIGTHNRLTKIFRQKYSVKFVFFAKKVVSLPLSKTETKGISKHC